MVLSWMMMAENAHSTGKNTTASQGGLTSPKLSDSGLDFRIAVAKNGRGRHVRISCIFVTPSFFGGVKCCINVCANQLHKCHCGQNITSSGNYVTLPKCHSCTNTTDPLQWKMTPPVENDREPLQWKMTPPRELETTSGNNS